MFHPVSTKHLLRLALTIAFFNSWQSPASCADVNLGPKTQEMDSVQQAGAIEQDTTSNPGSEPALANPGQFYNQPRIIKTMPPPVVERPPIPVPPPLMLLPPLGSGKPKLPLNWRARAYKLVKEQMPPKEGARELFYANLQDTFLALSIALKEIGLVVRAQFPEAGHLLAEMDKGDGNLVSVVGALRAQQSDRTEVMLLLEPKSFSGRMRLVEAIFSKIRSLIERNKLL